MKRRGYRWYWILPLTALLTMPEALACDCANCQAAQAAAGGVVGVEIESHILEFPTGSETVGGRIVEWVILGTAVSPAGDVPRLATPKMVIPLRP
jgi:hypothetical protein